jgi:hypothetical protein
MRLPFDHPAAPTVENATVEGDDLWLAGKSARNADGAAPSAPGKLDRKTHHKTPWGVFNLLRIQADRLTKK